MECPKVFVSVGSLCLESVNPVGIYMFKLRIETLEQGVKYVQS